MTDEQIKAYISTLAKEIQTVKKAHNELVIQFEALARKMTGQPPTQQDAQMAAFYSGGEEND